MARPVPVAVLIALALFVVGCGGGSSTSTTKPKAPAGSKVVACGSGGLRATSVDCASARKAMNGWESDQACALSKDESRGACSVDGFRCQAVQAGKGTSVSCARPGEAVAFISRRGG
ncbi:MAG TPA: hypothetical protein VN671_02885 [Solirubrobacterales bacterium]|nr:hypothetical protein [Solirubrobacterales bacterium]